MDPVTTAIIAALAAGVTRGGPQVAEQALGDAYAGLKVLLRQKLGEKSDVAKATDSLEAKPESAGRRELLREEVEASGSDQDPEILQAARVLLEQVRARDGSAARSGGR